MADRPDDLRARSRSTGVPPNLFQALRFVAAAISRVSHRFRTAG